MKFVNLYFFTQFAIIAFHVPIYLFFALLCEYICVASIEYNLFHSCEPERKSVEYKFMDIVHNQLDEMNSVKIG